LPVELHEKYGRILKQMMGNLFAMHVEVVAHYGFKKEDRALQKANEAIGKFRSLMEARVCAETPADYPATKVYYGSDEKWPGKN
jgi:hypothetical protein